MTLREKQINGVPIEEIREYKSYKNYALDNGEVHTDGMWNAILKKHMTEYFNVNYLIASVYDAHLAKYGKKAGKIILFEFDDGFAANSEL